MVIKLEGRLGKPEIITAKDHVIICGQVVQRPASIAPSQWLQFWERLAPAANMKG